MTIEEHVLKIKGPILILGASGFVGSNMLMHLLKYREDVYGTTRKKDTWRLQQIDPSHIVEVDLNIEANIEQIISQLKPKTVINLIAYGAYSFENDDEKIYKTNFLMVEKLVRVLEKEPISVFLHAGSSSEYGDNSAGPSEEEPCYPNSSYSVSKLSAAHLLMYYGKKKGFPCANLRLYSVYGPFEDSSRLIPQVVIEGMNGKYPNFVNPLISRDFIYIDDVIKAFILAAVNLSKENYGESFNIGTGRETTIGTVAEFAKSKFGIPMEPNFNMPDRKWDRSNWYANPDKANKLLSWKATVTFNEGLDKFIEWYKNYYQSNYRFNTKFVEPKTKNSVSVIVACYKDQEAIPIMYQRLKTIFEKLQVDYEIIFVNDNSPDNSEDVIAGISNADPRVIGISHSRNFGSQAAFRSGMEMASKDSCVLMDGDLQDPPELLESFIAKWREGYDVVFGRRVKREAPFYMQVAYKFFYRVFDYFSYLAIPHDAGDFCLMDKKVVKHMLSFQERDLFWRGIRAFIGFKQTGVDYLRPERMFGRSTNNLRSNINWAKKGILSFSHTPLTILSYTGSVLLLITTILCIIQIIGRILLPSLVPQGVTTILLSVLFFGSVNLFAIGIVGEYIAKIFDEVKGRPAFIRKNIISHGEVIPVEHTEPK
ncbi:NAD-dependent epimerase/dehydratase family protein [Paenibacillus silviterrae]|uniref:NAD-dependent epimerase/dehydratase family protein n=1 Tax=Paenibacillus silviterrae TaxID=3242194 RepID=UPI002543027D|nr:NAD-dependent epimerase/dehydratase family protein [Paenibacillus chinjuensis]